MVLVFFWNFDISSESELLCMDNLRIVTVVEVITPPAPPTIRGVDFVNGIAQPDKEKRKAA